MMLASVGMPAMLTCPSLGPIAVCMMGFLRCVTAFTSITGSSAFARPVYPGNTGIALPVPVFWSSQTRTFGSSSPLPQGPHSSLSVCRSPRVPPRRYPLP